MGQLFSKDLDCGADFSDDQIDDNSEVLRQTNDVTDYNPVESTPRKDIKKKNQRIDKTKSQEGVEVEEINISRSV